jgi:hypothetical protein
VTRVEADGTRTSYSRLGNQQIGRLTIAKTNAEGDRVQIQLEDQQSYNEEFLQALSRGIAANVLRLMGAPIR